MNILNIELNLIKEELKQMQLFKAIVIRNCEIEFLKNSLLKIKQALEQGVEVQQCTEAIQEILEESDYIQT